MVATLNLPGTVAGSLTNPKLKVPFLCFSTAMEPKTLALAVGADRYHQRGLYNKNLTMLRRLDVLLVINRNELTHYYAHKGVYILEHPNL